MFTTISDYLGGPIRLMYLRKSRQDDPNETVEEVLRKHETILQDFALREFGKTIPEDCIYREVVSGESIADRFEIKKVLKRIEDPRVEGVLVVDPQRLSRGDLEDCGRLISILQYTKTLVHTPTMRYDLDKKVERRFFQDELLRGRDFLEYIKEILHRGSVAAIQRGCYIAPVPPYGYRKIKIGKDCTLEPDESADVVRLIFDLYVSGTSIMDICHILEQRNIPTPRGGQKWFKETVRHILRNKHYDGKVIAGEHRKTFVIEDGERKLKTLKQAEADVLVVEGKHEALVDHDTFVKAQEIDRNTPRVKRTSDLANPFGGLVRCGHCGRVMIANIYPHTTRLVCRREAGCIKSVKLDDVYNKILEALELAELPAMKAQIDNGDSQAEIQRRILKQLERQMQDYRAQEDKQFDLLETGRYSQELFDRRNGELRAKMAQCQQQINEARRQLPIRIDYAEKVRSMEDAIAALRDPDLDNRTKNRLLRSLIDRIIYNVPPEGEPRRQVAFTLDIKLKF